MSRLDIFSLLLTQKNAEDEMDRPNKDWESFGKAQVEKIIFSIVRR